MKRDISLNVKPSSKGRQVWLSKLLDGPLPTLRLQKASTQTTHTSGHEPIEREIEDQELNMIEGLIEFLQDKFQEVDTTSMFLNRLSLAKKQERYYTSEPDIQSLIGDLLIDIISLLTMEDKIFPAQETFVPHARYLGRSGGNKSDFWLIYRDFLPILVVEVKSPHVLDVLRNECVVGQICDYMIDIASFYGQRDVFGITTTGKEWKFHWFPSCDDAAKATEIVPEEQRRLIINEPPPTLSRVVCSTNPIPLEHPSLVALLLSVFLKSAFSSAYKVPLISPTRKYITLSEDTWSWSVLKPAILTKLEKLAIDVNPYVDRSSEFVVLNHLARNRDQLVWIALAGESSRIVVIKQYPPEFSAKADIEQSIWQTVNQAHALVRTVRGLRSLIVPLVFHARIDEEGVPYFNCDLLSWMFPPGAVSEDLPESLTSLQNRIMVAAEQWENRVVDAARQAIKDLAKHKIVHDDLQWRHFALMPRFNKGEFCDLVPIMIDFSYSHRVESELEASTTMMTQLDALMNNNIASPGSSVAANHV